MALCVAIFDKEDTLQFLKIKDKGIDQETSLNIQRFLHNSYDIILDKTNSAGTGKTHDLFLGSLLLNTSFRSYGYLTNTSIKFLLVTEAQNSMLKDHEIRLFFKRLHSRYCNALSDLFHQIGTPLKSRYIDEDVQELLDCF